MCNLLKVVLVLLLLFLVYIFGSIFYYSVVGPEEFELNKLQKNDNLFKTIKISGYIQEYERNINDGGYYKSHHSNVFLYGTPNIYKLNNNENNSVYIFFDTKMDVNKKVEIIGFERIVHNNDNIFFVATKYKYIN